MTIAVGVRPSALDDSYSPTVLGNVSIDTSTSSLFNVLDNDSGDLISFTTTNLTSAQGGDVTLNNDGTFSYDPFPGFEGNDSFDLQRRQRLQRPADRHGQPDGERDALVHRHQRAQRAGGDGRLSDPFNCLVGTGCFDPTAADDPGDSIFLASGAYTGGLTLLASQLFIGEGVAASLSTINWLTPPADSPSLPATNGIEPQITTSDADAVILGTVNTNGWANDRQYRHWTGNLGAPILIRFCRRGDHQWERGRRSTSPTETWLAEFREHRVNERRPEPGISLVGVGGWTPV